MLYLILYPNILHLTRYYTSKYVVNANSSRQEVIPLRLLENLALLSFQKFFFFFLFYFEIKKSTINTSFVKINSLILLNIIN